MTEDKDGRGGLLSPSDIAELAQVSRGAVSNWRKRSPGFPEPVDGTSAKPLFDRRRVVEWMKSTGREVKDDSAQLDLWAQLNSLRGVITRRDLPAIILAEAVRGSSAGTGLQFASGIDADAEQRIRSAIEAIPTQDRGPAIDYVLERHAKLDVRSGGEHGFVGSRTASLLGNLAAAHSATTIYDPACGIGGALLVAAEANPSVVLTGDDIDAEAVGLARARASLRGLAATFACGDVLGRDLRPNEVFDVVVAEPPLGMRWADSGSLADPRFAFGVPPSRSSELAWIQHVIAHLNDGGAGYVLTSRAVLSRRGPEERIRAELLRRGCLRAVVGLPSRMLPHTSIPLVLWVLSRPSDLPPATVRMVDASDAAEPEQRIVAWLKCEFESDEVRAVEAELTEVLAGESDLEPTRWITPATPDPAEADDAARVARAMFERSAASLTEGLAEIDEMAVVGRGRIATLGELLDRKIVTLVPAVLMKAGRDDGEVDIEPITNSHVRSGQLPERTGKSTAPTTEVGDVIISSIETVRAVVDSSGGHRVKSGLHVLRVLDRTAVAPEFLALMLAGSWNNRFQRGTTIRRATLKALEIPILEVEDQRCVVAGAADVLAVKGRAIELARDADSLLSAMLAAVRFGGGVRVANELEDGDLQ